MIISTRSSTRTSQHLLKQVTLGIIGVFSACNKRLIEVELLGTVFGQPVVLDIDRLALLVAPAEGVRPIRVEVVRNRRGVI